MSFHISGAALAARPSPRLTLQLGTGRALCAECVLDTPDASYRASAAVNAAGDEAQRPPLGTWRSLPACNAGCSVVSHTHTWTYDSSR